MSSDTLKPKKSKVVDPYEKELNNWIKQERAALDLIGIVGKLWFEKSIELIIFRIKLVDRSASEIMNLHLYYREGLSLVFRFSGKL